MTSQPAHMLSEGRAGESPVSGAAVFLTGFLVALAACLVSVATERFWHTDSEFYWIHAEGILQGTLWFPYNPWGYSVLLVPFVWLGLSPVTALLVLHPPAAGACVWLLARLCREHGRRCTLVAVGLLLTHLGFQSMAALLLPDLWTALLLLLTASALKRGRGVESGLWLGLGAWVRSAGLTAACAVMAVLLLFRRGLLVGVVSGFLVTLVAVSLWAGHLAGHPMFISDQGSLGHHWKPVAGGFTETTDDERERRGDLGYVGFALVEPATFVQERYFTAMNLLFPWPLGDERGFWHKTATAYPEALLWALAGVALATGKGRRLLWRSWPLWALALGAAAVHLAFHSQIRHRTMWAPLWIALLVPAAQASWVKWRGR